MDKFRVLGTSYVNTSQHAKRNSAADKGKGTAATSAPPQKVAQSELSPCTPPIEAPPGWTWVPLVQNMSESGYHDIGGSASRETYPVNWQLIRTDPCRDDVDYQEKESNGTEIGSAS